MQWKKYLTTMQITQFVIDLVAVYFGSKFRICKYNQLFVSWLAFYLAYSYFVATYALGKFPALGTCAGTEGAAIFGCGLLTSYLGLFIDFYIRTYKKPIKGKKPVTNGSAASNGSARINGVAK